jgi:hypothetical protein
MKAYNESYTVSLYESQFNFLGTNKKTIKTPAS